MSCVPNLHKYSNKTVYRFALDSHAGIFPLPVRMSKIEILVGYVITARMRHFSVHYRDFPVVAVVHKYADYGNHRVKRPAFDIFSSQTSYKRPVDKSHTAYIVENNPDVNAVARFFFKNSLYSVPNSCVFDGVILHKNVLFRHFHVVKQTLERVASIAEIFYGGIFIHREICKFLQIIRLSVKVVIFCV